jgi:hypothetical protein
MQIFMAKKKAEDMREQLRDIISVTRGPSAWKELVATEASIRKKRQQAIYDQEERQKFWVEMASIGAGVIGIVAVVAWLLWVYLENTGHI